MRLTLADRSLVVDVFAVILGLEVKEQALVANITWNWWLKRNKVREGGVCRSADELTNIFLEVAATPLVRTCKQRTKWQKPDDEWVKVNSDGSFLELTGSGGWGAVIRIGMALLWRLRVPTLM
ncbi:hypothetical protein BRADI_5g21465v3 [Brachypodium distachyon]|uniref:RNase H type-1 domain-containing protein n=1 Tax=Brachypodium distachyon TaxID=15368 RepID=A0A0Q3IEF9_BRADI|nr:hypothetical protein BRADI_5g21465v3 [Brachypodium distachyon]